MARYFSPSYFDPNAYIYMHQGNQTTYAKFGTSYQIGLICVH